MNYLFCTLFIVITAVSISAQPPSGGSFYQEVAWSPDGNFLSFSKATMTIREGTRKLSSDVYTIRSDGTLLQKITGNEKNEYFSTWSRDGRKIAFSAAAEENQSSDIYIGDKDGGELTQLTKNSGRNSGPAFSPDGKKIAFMSTRDGGHYQIYVMNADGKDQKRLTTDSTVGFFNPQWSPDGKKLVYYSEKGDKKDQIWMMGSDGRSPTLLTNNIGHNFYPSFSPRGKVIFVSSRDGNDDLVYVMDPDGSNLKLIEGLRANYVRFSPDGKKIAYIFGKFPTSDIFIADADGTNSHRLIKE